MGVEGLPGFKSSKFTSDGLAHDDCTRRPQPRYAGRIRERAVAVVNGRPHSGRHIPRVDNVLYAYGHARHGPFFRASVNGTRLSPNKFRIEKFPSLHVHIPLFDTGEAVLSDGVGSEVARVNALSYFLSAKCIEVISHAYRINTSARPARPPPKMFSPHGSPPIRATASPACRNRGCPAAPAHRRWRS